MDEGVEISSDQLEIPTHVVSSPQSSIALLGFKACCSQFEEFESQSKRSEEKRLNRLPTPVQFTVDPMAIIRLSEQLFAVADN